MDPATVLAAQAGRALAPYLWRALTAAAVVGALLGVTVVITVAGAATRAARDDTTGRSATGCPVTGATGASAVAGGAVSVGGVSLDGEQLANAEVIVATGRQLGVPDRGLQVALATAVQESRLRNLPGGMGDSVGLFQQRPSQGWGSVAELLRPDYAATRFFQALQAVPGWETLPVTQAAQAVQRSAFPDAYQVWESLASALLALPGVRDVTCAVVKAAGTVFADAAGLAAVLPRANPRTVEQAIEWARQQAATGAGGWYRRCLAFVAQTYGWGFSGTSYAVDQYTAVMPTSLRHDGDRNPPPGALLFWSTSSRAGHVALYVGGGMVASNDIQVDGQISIVPASDIETRWGATYLGWSPPYFPGGG